MNKTIIIFFSTLLVSCGPIYYAPNGAHVPLFKERNQIAASVNTADNGVQFDGAYSISNRVMVCTSGSFARPKEDKSGNGGTANLIEVGGGYYRPLNNKFVFGANLMAGIGDMENHYPSANGSIDANFLRLTLNPYIGYTSKVFETSFSARFVGMQYSNIDGQLTLSSIDQVNYLSSNSTQMFVEPALTFRIGYKFIFFQVQDVLSINISDADFPDDNNTILAGIFFRYKLGLHGQ